MDRSCDFCSTSSAVVHCKADAAHLCLSCDSQLHSANQIANRHGRTILCDSCNHLSTIFACLDHDGGNGLSAYGRCLDHHHGGGLVCHFCDRSHHVRTSSVHQRLVSSNVYTGCPAAEDFAAIWGMQMNHDHTASTSLSSHLGSLDILDQILDLQRMQSTVPPGLCNNETSQLQSDQMQDQLGVFDDYLNLPDDEYLAFLNLEELIGDEDDQDRIVKTQELLDDHENRNGGELDAAAASIDAGPRECSSIPVDGSASCSLPSSVSCDTLNRSIISNGERVFDARANAMMRYKQKKQARVYERKIRYQKKKAIADSRKRVRGRFARKEEAGHHLTEALMPL